MGNPKNNFLELFNELCILLCAQLMNVFLEGVAPAPFMSKIGWTFMGVSIFNILINVVGLIVNQIYENGRKVR